MGHAGFTERVFLNNNKLSGSFMYIENLIKMANDIGAFFQSEPDRELAVGGVLDHISKFWDPRMRSQIKLYCQAGGEGVSDLVKEAINRLV